MHNPAPSVTADTAQERSALLVCALTSFLGPFGVSAINVALPAMQAELHLKTVTLTWVPTMYMLVMAIALVPLGALADRLGRKKIFGMGLWLYTLASLLGAVAHHAAPLLICRGLQGVGAGMFISTGMAILTSVFPPKRRGRVIGIYVAAVYIGLSAGPFVGGLLTGFWGWRCLFWLMLPLGAFCLVLMRCYLKGEWQNPDSSPFDLAGCVLYALAIAALVYGASISATRAGQALLAAGLLCGVAFVLHQYKSRHPVLDLRLFTANRSFAFSSFAALFNYSATYAVTFTMSLYLQYIQAMTPQAAGALLVAQPAVMALGSPLVGRLSERVPARLLSSAGMLLTTIGIACYTQLGLHTPKSWIFCNLLLIGTGFALFSSPNISAIMGAVDRSQYGVASGVAAIMRLLGQMTSMAMATVVLSLLLGNVAITPALYPRFLGAIHVVFCCSAVFCSLGLCCSLARGGQGDHKKGPAI